MKAVRRFFRTPKGLVILVLLAIYLFQRVF